MRNLGNVERERRISSRDAQQMSTLLIDQWRKVLARDALTTPGDVDRVHARARSGTAVRQAV